MKPLLLRSKQILQSHLLALIIALFVGVVFFLPQLFSSVALGDLYQGIPFLYQDDDEKAYLTNIQEILDGYPGVSSPVYHGYKDAPASVWPVGEYVYVGVHMLTGMPILATIVFIKSLLPAVLFLLVYALVYRLTSGFGTSLTRRLSGVAAGLLVVLGFDFANLPRLLSIVTGDAAFGYLNVWARLVNPITGGVFLFAVIGLLLSVFRGARWGTTIAAGMVAVLMFGYIFSYGLALAVTFFLMVAALLRRQYERLKHLGVVLAIGILPLIIKILDLLRSGLRETENSSLERLGIFYTHEPLWNSIVMLALVLFGFFSYFVWREENAQKDKTWWWFCLALLIASLSVYVQQIVTGHTIWPYHFVQYTAPIVFVVAVVVFHNVVLSWSKVFWFFVVGCMIAFSASYGLWMTTRYDVYLEDYIENQKFAPLYEWLTENTKDECVVLVVEEGYRLADKIPAHTPCDVYNSRQVFYGVPQERIEHGYYTWLRMRGVTGPDLEEYFRNNPMEVRRIKFENWMQFFNYVNDPWLKARSTEEEIAAWREESIDTLVDEYTRFLEGDLSKQLHEYQIDYIVWDKSKYTKSEVFGSLGLETIDYCTEGVYGCGVYDQ